MKQINMQNIAIEKLFRILFNILVLLMPIMILPYGMHDISRYVLFVIFSSPILMMLFLQMLLSHTLVNVRPIFIFLLPIFLSTIFSVNKFISLFGTYKNREGLITLFLYLVVFLSLVTFVKSKKQLLNISICLSVGLFINNLFGLYQVLFEGFGPGFAFGPRIITTFGDPNILGGFVVLTLPIIFSAIYLTDSRKIKTFTILNSLLAFLILIFTGSRVALIGLLVALLFFALYIRKINYKSLVIIFSILFLIVVNPFLSDRLKLSIFGPELINRIGGIKGALGYFTANPLFGSGPDTFRFFTNDYGGFGGAHSSFVHLVQNLGLLGLTAFLFIFFYVLLKGFQCIGKNKELLSVLYLISILSFFIFFLFSYTTSTLNIFLWINMALVICINNIKVKSLTNIKMPKLNFLLPFVGIICFLLIFLVIRIPIGGILWRQGKANADAGRHIEAVAKYKSAARMVPDDEIYLKDLGYLSIKLIEDGDMSYLPIAKKSLELTKKYINPNDPVANEALEVLNDIR